MPIEKGHKPYNTFVKGIITEASPLTFPENATIDEQNFILNRDGSRERRLGIDYETGYTLLDTAYSPSVFEGHAISTYDWYNVAGNATLVVTVIQIGTSLWFTDATKPALSANLLVPSPLVVGADGRNTYSFASIGGILVVVTGDNLPVYITYDGNDFIQSDINIKIRDFFGIDDNLDLLETPTSLSDAHNYNLFNQGWNSSRILSYLSSTGNYPANNHIWHVAKDTSDNFAPATIAKIDFGTTPAPKGRIVIDAFKRGEARSEEVQLVEDLAATHTITSTDRGPGVIYISSVNVYNVEVSVTYNDTEYLVPYTATIPLTSKSYSVQSGTPSYITINSTGFGGNGGSFISYTITYKEKLSTPLPLVLEEDFGRVASVAAYSGRMWYSGVSSIVDNGDIRSPNYNGFVFFSRLYENSDDLGRCYQEADPTSEVVSDLVDTDGGYLVIPEAHTIKKLVVTGKHLVVFAENGVWQIFGGEEGFSATSFQVYKITDVGIDSASSVVDVEGNILYWAKSGIYKLAADPVTNTFVSESLTFDTIDTLYDSISIAARSNATGIYDAASKRVKWLYNSSDSYDGITLRNKYDTELVLDVLLGAFYKNTITPTDEDSPFLAGYVRVSDFSNADTPNIVVVGTDTIQVSGVDVVIPGTAKSIATTDARYIAIKPTAGSNYTFTFADYTDTAYKDWNTENGNYFDSYMYTGYDLFDSASRDKYSPYITFYFNRTETGFDTNLNAINESSCFIQAQWEWSDNVASGRWSQPFQAYRLRRNYIPSGSADTFTYGFNVVTTKNKLRGRGKSLSLYIYSEDGKAMNLLGWGLDVNRSTS